MNWIKEKNNLYAILSLLLITFFYLWDLGNIDGLRQGTEGFYLQVTKEMFEAKSYLTPLYTGLKHFSKPPLQFWMGIFFFILGDSSSLFLGRLSMVFVSILGLLGISRWMKKNFNIPLFATLIFLGSSIGFIKYSRIFMMEIPLAIFSTLASLYWYQYLISKKWNHFIVSSLFFVFSCLIKGPIGPVMIIGGMGTYLLFNREKITPKIFLWVFISFLISSLWFIYSYLVHGMEFIQTFFIDQNMGKLEKMRYSSSVLWKGLIIFSLPWIIFLFYPLKEFIQRIKIKSSFSLKGPRAFLFFNFLIFFFIWFVPGQKSHHYAFPSVTFFLLFILASSYSKIQHSALFKIFIPFILILIGVLFLPLLFPKDFSNFYGPSFYFSILTLFLSLIFLFQKNLFLKMISPLLSIGSIWCFFIPLFYLPYLPQNVIETINHHALGVVVRKPYFVEELVDTPKMDIIDPGKIHEYILQNNHYYLVHLETYKNRQLEGISSVVYSWPIWKRGSSFSDIKTAISKQDLSLLKDEMFLLKNIDATRKP